MEKYRKLFSITWQNGLVYRASVLLWRLRQFLSSLMALTVWQVLFETTKYAAGYSAAEMATYVFLAALLQGLVLSSALHGLAGMIYSGELSNLLVKPMHIIGYLGIYELSDKLKNVFFLLIESGVLYFLFKPDLPLPSFSQLLYFCIFALGAVSLHFIITLLFGAMGFWSPDTWGPRFIFFMVVDFTAGKLFPLDILPMAIRSVLAFTPLPYLTFVPTQIFLERITGQELLVHSIVLSLWILLGILITRTTWHIGFKEYSAAGR